MLGLLSNVNRGQQRTKDMPPNGYAAARNQEPTPGFEPGTPRLRGECSGQLSYVGIVLSGHRTAACQNLQGTFACRT